MYNLFNLFEKCVLTIFIICFFLKNKKKIPNKAFKTKYYFYEKLRFNFLRYLIVQV